MHYVWIKSHIQCYTSRYNTILAQYKLITDKAETVFVHKVGWPLGSLLEVHTHQ